MVCKKSDLWSDPRISDSVQMYLVSVARLRHVDQPVPLSLLAQELGVSPVSVNEMCRKLQEQDLVVYQPYKGVSLTAEGEALASYVLRRHRLWEVLLVEKLGLRVADAHQMACQLEHATPNSLADRLDDFLEHPAATPSGQPIPRAGWEPPAPTVDLASLSVGQTASVVACEAGEGARQFLDEEQLQAGATLLVLATSERGCLVEVGDRHVSLARELAEQIRVELAPDHPKKRRAA